MLSIKTKAATAGSTCKFTGQVEWKIYRKPCCFSSNRSFLAKFPVNQLWESRHVLCNYLILFGHPTSFLPAMNSKTAKVCCQNPWTCRLRRPAGLDGVGPFKRAGAASVFFRNWSQPLWGHLICGTSQRSGAPGGGALGWWGWPRWGPSGDNFSLSKSK